MTRMPAPLTASLALQGGGAHGAFTWGVLDRLLEEAWLAFEGISATSSGAMNALALAQGWLDGGRDGARAALAALWERVAQETSALRWMFAGPVGGTAESLLLGLSQFLTPQEINPLGINPLEGITAALFDFERLRAAAPFRLFLAATRVRDGSLVLFGNDRLGREALLASACLPQFFPPVVIDGEHYWDGGYAGNPALEPLIYDCRSADLIAVLVQPLARAAAAQRARDPRAHQRARLFHHVPARTDQRAPRPGCGAGPLAAVVDRPPAQAPATFPDRAGRIAGRLQREDPAQHPARFPAQPARPRP